MYNTSMRWLSHQLKGFDWSLIKGSTLLSIGTAIARILGLAFSLVLAAAFPAREYGEIRYAIAVASIVAIGTMPFGQHVIARFVSKYRNDEAKLDSVLSNSFLILPVIFVVTLLIALPVLLMLGKFNIGILFIFLGETLFYAYWGLSSGFLEPRRLTVAYLGSNLVQILLVFVLIQLFGIRSPTLALAIYGLSYLLPLALLVIFWPLPGQVRLHLIDRNMISELLRFSLPIWVSHACYTFSLSIDFLLLERLGRASQLGAYSLSKTLATMFLIIPTGISTLLMPKVAASPNKGHGQLLTRLLIVSLLVDGIALVFYMPLVQPLTQRIFGVDYLVSLGVSLLLSLYMIMSGIHGLVTSVFVGSGKPQVESASRIVELIATGMCCFLLIPPFGTLGAAAAVLAGKMAALLTYGLLALSRTKISKGIFTVLPHPDRDEFSFVKGQPKDD
jgi:O-antigen/teichoic acid export membrane protein